MDIALIKTEYEAFLIERDLDFAVFSLYHSYKNFDKIISRSKKADADGKHLLELVISKYGKYSDQHKYIFSVVYFFNVAASWNQSAYFIQVIPGKTRSYFDLSRFRSFPASAIFALPEKQDNSQFLVPGDVKWRACLFLEELFKDIINNMIEISGCAPKLYHYTSLENAKNILIGGDIWLSEIDALNDLDEFGIGVSALARWGENIPQDIIRGTPIGCFFEIIKNGRFSDLRDRIFVCSFSREPDSSSQWMEYGDKGKGICIEFDWNFFTRKFPNMLLTDACYMENVSKTTELVLSRLAGELKNFSLTDAGLGFDLRDLETKISRLLAIVGSTFKGSGFKGENEVRFIVLEENDRKIETHPSRKTRITKLSLQSSTDFHLPVTGLIFGNKITKAEKATFENELIAAGIKAPSRFSRIRLR